MLDNIGSKFKDYSPLMVRAGLATLTIIMGAQALNSHIGRRDVAGLVVASIYLLGGVFVLIGWLTRWAAFALIVALFIAIVDGPKLHALVYSEFQYLFAALMMSVAVYCSGGGEWSVDLKNKRKSDK